MANITDLIEEQGGEENPSAGEVVDTETLEIKDSVQEPSIIGDRGARQEEYVEEQASETVEETAEKHGIPVEELKMLNRNATYEQQEAEAAIGIRPSEEDVLAEQVYTGQVEAEGQSPEVLQKVDERVADEKRRAENQVISGTLTERKDSLLAKGTEVIGEVVEGAGDLISKALGDDDGRSNWKKALPLELNLKTKNAHTDLADDFYNYLVEENLFNKQGLVEPSMLQRFAANFVNDYLSDGASTKSQREKWLDSITRGFAIRNGLSVSDRPFNSRFMYTNEVWKDLASGINHYQKSLDGRMPTARYDSEGNMIPFTPKQIRNREDEMDTNGVYDPLRPSQYRLGMTKKETEELKGVSEWANWGWQTLGVAFNKIGMGKEVRYVEPVPEMAGEMIPVVGSLALPLSNKPLAAATGKKVIGKLSTLVKLGVLENSMAVTEYYTSKKARRYNTLEGMIQNMNLSQVEKEEMGAWSAFQPLLKFADSYAKDSQFVITGDDDVDTAALKTMGSSLKASGLFTATGFGIAGAMVMLRPATRPIGKAASKVINPLADLSEAAIEKATMPLRRAADELGLSADDAIKAFKETLSSSVPTRVYGGMPDPSELWGKAKEFMKNLKGARTNRKNAELEADIKITQEIIDELDPGTTASKRSREKSQQLNTPVYNAGLEWNDALKQRIEADEHLAILKNLDIDTAKGKKELERLSKKHGTKSNIKDLKAELRRKRTAANKAEAKRKEAFDDEYNIDLDEWDASQQTLREFLEDQGRVTRKSKEGSTEEAAEKAEKIREKLGQSIWSDDLDEVLKQQKKNKEDTTEIEELIDLEKRLQMDEFENRKSNALAAFLTELNKYKGLSAVKRTTSGVAKARLEYFYVKLQKVLAEGDLLAEKGTRKAQAMQGVELPRLKDEAALLLWSRRNYAAGNLSAGNIFSRAKGYRRGKEFAGETGQTAQNVLEHFFNTDPVFKHRFNRAPGIRNTMAKLRMAKVASLVSSFGANVAAMMGIPVAAGRFPLQMITEKAITTSDSAISKLGIVSPYSQFAEYIRTARQMRKQYKPDVTKRTKINSKGVSPSALENMFHFVFNPTSRRNMDLKGSRPTGEYAAGFSGELDVFGRKADISGATPMGIDAIVTETKWLRNLRTGFVGLWELLPREIMQRIDRTTKNIGFQREFSRQLASQFYEGAGNIKRIKDDNIVNERQSFEIYNIMMNGKEAIESGNLAEHELRKYLSENLKKIYDGKLHKGYSDDELLDLAMASWENTMNRQREMTLQQNLPLGTLGSAMESATQDPYVGHFVMFGKTITNNISMGLERKPFFGALYDIYAVKGHKGMPIKIQNRKIKTILDEMPKAEKLEVLEKQISGAAFYATGYALVEHYSDRISFDKNGNLLFEVNVDYDTIKEQLMLSLEEMPDQLDEQMEGYNKSVMDWNAINDESQQKPTYDDPYKFAEDYMLSMLMPIEEGEKGRAYIRAPRTGWIGSMVQGAMAFYAGSREMDHLPTNYIQEKDYMNKLSRKVMKDFAQLKSHEVLDGYGKLFNTLNFTDPQNNTGVIDLLFGELASTFTMFKGGTVTGGEPFEMAGEMSRDYRAVGGLEEFMEADGFLSIPKLMNSIYGDDHISRSYTGMMYGKQRTQRPKKLGLLVEYDYVFRDIDDLIDRNKLVIKPIVAKQIIKGASGAIDTYKFRSLGDDDIPKGKTAYEEILDMAHSQLVYNEQTNSKTTYEESLELFENSKATKKLEKLIEKGIQAGKDNPDYRDASGTVVDKDVLVGMVAQNTLEEMLKGIRDAYKDMAVLMFFAEGKADKFVHIDMQEKSLSTQYNQVQAAEMIGEIGLGKAFDPSFSIDFENMSVEELGDLLKQKQEESLSEAVLNWMMTQ